MLVCVYDRVDTDTVSTHPIDWDGALINSVRRSKEASRRRWRRTPLDDLGRDVRTDTRGTSLFFLSTASGRRDVTCTVLQLSRTGVLMLACSSCTRRPVSGRRNARGHPRGYLAHP